MLFSIDEAKCTSCGRCVDECPTRIIVMNDGDTIPTPTADAQIRCISCGHCVAICPHGALSLGVMPVEQCVPIRESSFPRPDNLEHFFKARRSVRSFKDETVKRGELEKTIEMARYAPTGSNSQKVKWIVVYNREDVLKIAGMVADYFRLETGKDPDGPAASRLQRIITTWESGFDYICRGAPHLVLTHAPDARGATDCIIALTYQELAAFSLGLGTCWGGYIMMAARQKWPDLMSFLDIPADHTVFGAMMVGYPKYKFQRLPLRNQADLCWVDQIGE